MLNNNADNIIGKYESVQGGETFNALIEKLPDGTYRGRIIWMQHDKDEKGQKLLDKKNPDKSLRVKPLDKAVLFSGLKYNSKEKIWDGCKIYDPQRGIRAHLKAEFTPDGRLKLKGSLLGISESVYWKRVAN